MMFKLSEILDFLVYSNIYIALAATSLTYVLFKIVNIPVNYVLIVPFFIMFAIYTFNRKTDENEDSLSNPKKTTFNRKYNKYFLFASYISYGVVVSISAFKGITYGLYVLVPFLIGVLYSQGITLGSKKMRFKNIFFFKNLIVSITWSYVTIILPILLLNVPLTLEVYFLSIIVFLRVIINNIFFDIKDIIGDTHEKIKTIPSKYGKLLTEKLLIFLNSSYIYAISIIYLMAPYNWNLFAICFFSGIYGFFYMGLYSLDIMDINQLSYIIADGELIAVGVFAYLLR